MLVILADRNVLPVDQVCSGCPLANHHGQPRWHQGAVGGSLGCGHPLNKTGDNQPDVYECTMGFRVVNIG